MATDSGAVVRYPQIGQVPGGYRSHSNGLNKAPLTLLARSDSLYAAGPSGIWTWRPGSGGIWAWGRANLGAGAPPDSFQIYDLIASPTTIWVAGSGGVYRRDHATGWSAVGSNSAWSPNARISQRAKVTSLARTASGILFAGIDDPSDDPGVGGTWKWTNGQWTQFYLPGPPLHSYYRSLRFDPDGALWMSSAEQQFSAVLSRYQGGRWRRFFAGGSDPLPSWTFNIAEAGSALWLARCCCTPDTNHCRMERVTQSGTSFSFAQFNPINAYDVTTDSEGRLWIATEGAGSSGELYVPPKGIFCVDLAADSTVQISQAIDPRLVSDNVSSIRVDGNRVWIGYVDKGVSCWNLSGRGMPRPGTGTWRNYSASSGADSALIGNSVQTLAIGPDGRVWIGTTAGLAICSTNGLISNVTPGFGGLLAASVVSILPTSDGGAWVGTWPDGGLARMTPRSFGGFDYTHYLAPPLPNPTVNAMTYDPDGVTLWLATSRGLASFLPPQSTPGLTASQIGAYPNPFRPGCADGIRLLGTGGYVSGVVTDMTGKVLARFPAGGGGVQDPTTVIWDGKHNGRPVAPGLYWMRVHTPTGIHSVGVAIVDAPCGQ